MRGTSTRATFALLGLLLLGACGGDDDAAPPAPTATLAAATATSTAAPPSATATTAPATPTATRPAPTATPTLPTATATPPATATATLAGVEGAVAPLAAAGRWFVDALGRVVMLHGVNMVAKRAPFHPAALGFGADDAGFLAAEAFNALRLGVDFRALMPTPGVVESEYIEHLAETVEVLAQHGIFVLLDFHQDGFAPMYNGNGFPDWLAVDDGLPNPPDAVFPLYYIQNPAMQRAFESFWANRPGPGGVPLQDYFFQGVAAVVARFAGEPLVLGTDLMNEPWPGAVYLPCAADPNGCPDLEGQRLEPFYQRGVETARPLAPRQFVFVEPFVLFNFGQANTSLPGAQPGRALSFHAYALNGAGEEGVVSRAIAAAERDGAPLLLTEFGATTDAVVLNRLTAQMERGLVPWLFWAYNESIIADLQQPAGPDNLRSRAALDALVRPYPIATAGTPTEIAFDPVERRLRLAYETTPPAGASLAADTATVVSMPRRHYPQGYAVNVAGAAVTSAPCATLLTLRNDAGAARVSLEVAPAAGVCPD